MSSNMSSSPRLLMLGIVSCFISSWFPITFGVGGAKVLFALAPAAGYGVLRNGLGVGAGCITGGRLSISYLIRFYGACLSFALLLSKCTVMPLRSNRVSIWVGTYMRQMGSRWVDQSMLERSQSNLAAVDLPQQHYDSDEHEQSPSQRTQAAGCWARSRSIHVWRVSTRELFRQICHELRVVFEVLEQGFDSEFWVPGHADEANILEFEKLLFVSKHALEEVFVHHHIRWEVQLYYGKRY